jgi:hypothetical protein
MKRSIFWLLGCGLALHGMAQLPHYDTSVYTFLRSAVTDSIILGQQQLFRQQHLSVTGTVSDDSALRLPGATVMLGNGAYQTVAGKDGRFSFDLPNEALQTWNVFSVSAPGKKTAVQTLHWSNLPAVLDFRLQPLTLCGCPPDSIPPNCCNIRLRMTVDQLFEKEKTPQRQRPLKATARRQRTKAVQR